MDDSGSLALIMATAAMTMLANRKNLAPPVESDPPATTNTISPEEQAEMERAPRAYRRRQIKALKKALP